MTHGSDQTQMQLQIAENSESIYIESCKSLYDGMNVGFAYEINAIISQNINPENLLYQNTQFILFSQTSNARIYHGIITKVLALGEDNMGFHYQFIFADSLELLTISRNQRVYINQGLNDLLRELLKPIAEKNFIYSLQINKDILVKYFVQYQLNHLDFLKQLCAHYGLFFYYDHSESQSVLIVTDNLSQATESIAIQECSHRDDLAMQDLIYDMQDIYLTLPNKSICINDRLLDEIDVKYFSASSYLKNQLNIQSQDLLVSDHEDDFLQIQVQRKQNVYDQMNHLIFAKTNCRSVKPGQILQVTKLNQEIKIYRMLAIDLNLSQFVLSQETVIKKSAAFELECILIEELSTPIWFDQDFFVNWLSWIDLPMKNYWQLLIIKEENFPTWMTANIESSFMNELKSDLTENGEYMFRYHFDTSDYPLTQASTPTLLLSNYGGVKNNSPSNNYGQHFPLLNNTSVLITKLQSQANYPIIFAPYPESIYQTPVTLENHSQHRFVTPQGLIFNLSDELLNTYLLLSAPNQQTYLKLDASENTSGIYAKSIMGGLTAQSAENIEFTTAEDYLIQVAEDALLNTQGNQQFITKENLLFDSGENIDLQSSQNLLWQAEENIISDYGKQLNLQSDGEILLASSQQDILLSAEQGAMTIYATGFSAKTSSQGEITIGNDNSHIVLQNGQHIKINAKNIVIEAEEIHCSTGLNWN